MVDFVAIDVETANADCASICSVGIVAFKAGAVAQTWTTLVDPEDEFDGINVSIHGIDEDAVDGAPTFAEIHATLSTFLAGKIVACHTAFDRVSMRRAQERYEREQIDCTWLDSARVVRRAWPQFAQSGYGLANVAETLGIAFNHHDALEDARACGEILVRAVAHSGMLLDAWIERLARRANDPSADITRDGNVDGPLYGEQLVFTGTLYLPRREAADLAAQAGCRVAASVTSKTTLLVVGDQDIRRVGLDGKSSKHERAETLIRAGQKIRILTESDFRRLLTP